MTTAMTAAMTTPTPPLEHPSLPPSPQTLSRRVTDFFFHPSTAADLGICRMLFFGLLILLYLRTDFSRYGALPPSFYNTLPVFRLLHLPIFSVKYLAILEAAFKLALVGGCIGRFTRVSTFVAAITGSYLLAVPNNFGRAGHGDGVIIILLWVLAFSQCGDAWSLDARYARRAGSPDPKPSGEYTWPIRMVWVLMSMVYLAAGTAKLRASGLAWVTSDNMAMTFLAHQVNNSNPLLDWGQYLARLSWFSKGLAGFTLVLEIGFPLALFSRRARWFFVASMFMAHVGIALLMGVIFWQFMITYVFWVSWTRMRRKAEG